jgi:D-lactate dehydrogenase
MSSTTCLAPKTIGTTNFRSILSLINLRLRLLAWGTDASFYRLIPQVVVVVESEDDVAHVLAIAAQQGVHLTFRAAGTSLVGPGR